MPKIGPGKLLKFPNIQSLGIAKPCIADKIWHGMDLETALVDGDAMYSRIIHPTDFSDASLPAMEAAHDLAGKLGAELTICFLADPPLVAQGDTITNPDTGETRDIAVELEAHHPTSSSVVRDLQILITDRHTSVKKMLGFLRDTGSELLVIGVHRRAGIAGWFGPSITDAVVRKSKCAVLVVKQAASTDDENEAVVDESMAE